MKYSPTNIAYMKERRKIYRRMIEDDDFFDFNPRLLVKLVHRIAMKGNFKLAQMLRVKYDSIIDDEEKKTLQRLGVRYDEHDVTYRFNSQSGTKTIFIDGLTVLQWELLNTDNITPSYSTLATVCHQFDKAGKTDAATFLKAKYADIFKAHKETLMQKHQIPSNADIHEISGTSVDGLTFFEWRLLYDENFIPPYAALMRKLSRYEKDGDTNRITTLLNKYGDMICADSPEEELLSEDECDAFFQNLFADFI